MLELEQIRLIASDVDGTMLPRGGRISEGLKAAVGACRARGIPFIIASGRWIGAIDDIAAALGVADQPVILANGGAVAAPDRTLLREWFMPDADVRRVYGILRRHDVMINSFVHNGLYRINTRAVRQISAIRPYLGSDFREVNDDPEAFERFGLERVYKLEAITEDAALLARVRGELLEAGMSVTSSFWRNAEIMSPGMGKGTALRWLAGELGVPLERCMAFGDNTNDLDMLEAVGWPVAMDNAVDALKVRARIVAPAAEADGVARVLRARVLGEGSL